MALKEPLAGARLVALDTSTFIYLIEKHLVFFGAVAPIFQAIDGGDVQAVTSVLSLLEVLVKPLETQATALADDFRAAVSASPDLRVVDVDRQIAERAAAIRAAQGCRTPEAVHLATADVVGADVFVSNDARLRSFGAVQVVTMADLAGP